MYQVYLFGKMKEPYGDSVTIHSPEAKLSKAAFIELLFSAYPRLSSHQFSVVVDEKKVSTGDDISPSSEIVLIPKV